MSRKYKWLTFTERKKIEEMYADDVSVTEISEAIGRSRHTIYAELKRGATGSIDQNMRPGYSAEIGQRAQSVVQEQLKAHCKNVATKKWDDWRAEHDIAE